MLTSNNNYRELAKQAKELKNADLPDEIKIGAVLREKEVIIPRSNYVFKKNDIVVFLAKKDQIPLVENIFRISAV